MKNLTLLNIAAACHGTLHCEESITNQEVAGVVLDSRLVETDYLFIATRGEKVDGHEFIDQVFEQGAQCVVCEKIPKNPVKAYILVEDSLIALMQIAEYYRSGLSVKVVGITGSVGKTSTKEFIAGVLEQKYEVLKTNGNYNNEIGVPLTILRIRDNHEFAVIEMGINHFGEMSRLSKMAKPDCCVLTNIGQCHLEFLGTRAGILKAKSEIFESMAKQGSICINGDDDMLLTIPEQAGRERICFGLSKENDIYADNIVNQGLFGSTCMIHIKEKAFSVSIPLPGMHMVYNALAATAVGNLFQVEDKDIIQGIASMTALNGRTNVIKTNTWVLIDDCYNANPVSMKAAIAMLATATTRKVAILGDMGELGADAVTLHREIGMYCDEQGIDLVIAIGEYAKEMLSSKAVIKHFATKEEFLHHRGDYLQENDTILVKASHFMGFEEIVTILAES